MRPLAAANLLSQLQLAGRRSYATSRPSLVASRARWTPRPAFHQIALRQSIRNQSTEAAPQAPKPKKKRAGILRWTWRLTYGSAILGLAYVGYGIWEMRNPDDQPDPDPSKKTLVILGTFRPHSDDSMASN
jgi:NADH:ubiquinone reductase (non-electrogenic)